MRAMKTKELGEKVTARGLLVVGSCAAVVSIAVACGGKVTWVEDGAGNSGGASSGTQSTGTKMTSATSSKASTGTTSPSSSTGISMTACEKICAIPACGGGSGCLDSCLSLYTPGCESQADAYLNCIVNNIDQDCTLTTNACDGLSQAYDQCQQQSSCVSGTCEVSDDGSCKCDGVCFGTPVSAACNNTPMGAQCDCFQGNTLVGQCVDMVPNCSLDQGCCAQFFQPILD